MISNEETMPLSPFMGIYELVVPKDNILRFPREAGEPPRLRLWGLTFGFI